MRTLPNGWHAAATRVRSRATGRALVARLERAGGCGSILPKDRRESSWDVVYMLPPNVTARDVGITFDIVYDSNDGYMRRPLPRPDHEGP